MPNLINLAETLPETAWKALLRKPHYTVATEPRRKPANLKEQIVQERGYKNIRLQSEQVAEFDYRPVKCKQAYRVLSASLRDMILGR